MRDDRLMAFQYATVAVCDDVEDGPIDPALVRQVAAILEREIERAMAMPPAIRSSFPVTGPEPERRLYAVNVGVMT